MCRMRSRCGFLVEAVGLTLGFSDALVLLGAASLSTLVPSGPAFLPVALIAAGILVHGSGTALCTILAGRQSDDGRAGE
jgi:hypothetical protein